MYLSQLHKYPFLIKWQVTNNAGLSLEISSKLFFAYFIYLTHWQRPLEVISELFDNSNRGTVALFNQS